jgi:hypothetical protein
MRRKRVASSVIAEIGYDDTHGLLEVEFHNGRKYYYLSVPSNVYESLMAADSIGGYFNEKIRKNYRTVRVRPGQ